MGNDWGECSEALNHGPADGRGRCPWCGVKYTSAQPAPPIGWDGPSELTEAWGEHFDPDYGALSPDQIRHRYQMGQTP